MDKRGFADVVMRGKFRIIPVQRDMPGEGHWAGACRQANCALPPSPLRRGASAALPFWRQWQCSKRAGKASRARSAGAVWQPTQFWERKAALTAAVRTAAAAAQLRWRGLRLTAFAAVWIAPALPDAGQRKPARKRHTATKPTRSRRAHCRCDNGEEPRSGRRATREEHETARPRPHRTSRNRVRKSFRCRHKLRKSFHNTAKIVILHHQDAKNTK